MAGIHTLVRLPVFRMEEDVLRSGKMARRPEKTVAAAGQGRHVTVLPWAIMVTDRFMARQRGAWTHSNGHDRGFRMNATGTDTGMNGTGRAEASAVMFRAEGITRVYRMGEVEVHALRGIDLELHPGEFVVILGPSGCGKSTLLNILGGLDVPTAGRVWYNGQDLTHADDGTLTQFRRDNVGFVFQFYNLIPSLTARENVAIVTEIARHPMRPEDALALVGLDGRLNHFPAQMSGGEQQRVAIARAIAKQPAVLLCDEPTGALDSATGVRVLTALDEVNASLGTCTVVITHNADIARMAHRVLTMGDGRIVDVKVNEHRLKADELRW